MVSIRKSIIPKTNRNYQNVQLNPGNLWITIHETGNTSPGADARGEESFMWSGGGPETVSYHLTVDHREAIQLLPLNIIGWHAGDGADNRNIDIGAYASIAIEVCVGDNNAHKEQTRKNLIELLVAILTGDSRFEWAGVDYRRFSVDRIAPHKKWSSYSKDCPHFMLADGYFNRIPSLVNAAMNGDAPGSGSTTLFVSPSPIKELETTSTDSIIVLPDGTDCFFLDATVEALRATRRRQKAYDGSQDVGPLINEGERFKVKYLFKADDGRAYWYTPYATRVLMSDTRIV